MCGGHDGGGDWGGLGGGGSGDGGGGCGGGDGGWEWMLMNGVYLNVENDDRVMHCMRPVWGISVEKNG